MHDPMTVAFTIKFPWYHTRQMGKSTYRYWEDFITIWHVDPEKGGSDDSCGWFTPPFTGWQRDLIKNLAGDEAREPWFMRVEAKSNDDPVLCEALVRGAFHLVSRCLRNRGHWWLAAKPSECERWAVEMTHDSADNFRNSLCFLSGYHSNWYRDGIPNTEEEDKFWREYRAKLFFGAILGMILRERRFWFNKPKWHIWHWHLQIHPLQAFKRWAFSRCCKCGGRFTWGYSPVSNQWDGDGPAWFRSESGVFHSDCDRPADAARMASDKNGQPA